MEVKKKWVVRYPRIDAICLDEADRFESESFSTSRDAYAHVRQLKDAFKFFGKAPPNDAAFTLHYRGTMPSWQTTFNERMVPLGQYTMDEFENFVSTRTEYPFYSWNGKVYPTADSGIEAICLTEEMART